MKTVDEMYRGSFFSRRSRLIWRVPHVCNAICLVLNPLSVMDVGCGIGDYVVGFLLNGVKACGLEGSENCLPYLIASKDRIVIADIRNAINKSLGWYDLVLCLEMLEHIEEEFADIVVGNLASMSDRILTSAAPPGQGGHYHVNCQPKSYWIEKFAAFGYKYDESVVAQIRKEWEPVRHKKEMSAYYKNLMYFYTNQKIGK